jgi:hypothetical protein
MRPIKFKQGHNMSIRPETQPIVSESENPGNRLFYAGFGPADAWCCGLCMDHATGESLVDALTPETRRFVERRLSAAIAELKTRQGDPDRDRRHAVWLAIDGLSEVIEELGL